MKALYYILISMFIISDLFAQVGINTEQPNPYTALDVQHVTNSQNQIISYKGVSLPSLTTSERDRLPSDELPDNLIIYNTTENCFNYYSTEKKWQSLCGQSQSVAILGCNSIEIHGSYEKDVPLTPAEYITIEVNVQETGNYTIAAIAYETDGTTPAGYYGFRSGSFISTGPAIIKIDLVGTPVKSSAEQGNLPNTFSFTINDIDACSGSETWVGDPSISPSYTIDCGSITVNGEYSEGQPLNDENYIDIPVNIQASAVGAAYDIRTDTVNGYYFISRGVFVNSGNSTIRLYGYGVPIAGETNRFTITSDGNTATCSIEIEIAMRLIRLLSIRDENNFSNLEATISNESLFGKTPDAIYKVEGFDYNAINPAAIVNLADTITKYRPDIILFQTTSYALTDDDATILSDFIQTRGALIFCSGNSSGMSTLLLGVTGTLITPAALTYTGTTAPILNKDLPVLTTPQPIAGQVMNITPANANGIGIPIIGLPIINTTILVPYADNNALNKQHARILTSRDKGLFFSTDGNIFTNTNMTLDGNNIPANTNAWLFVNAFYQALEYIKLYKQSGNEPVYIP